MIKKYISIENVPALCFMIGGFFSLIPFIMQIIMTRTPEEGSHVFTFFANQIILNGKISLLYALLSIIGATLIGFGMYSINSTFQEKLNDPIMNLATYLFLIATFGFIISWSQDYVIIWGDAKDAVNHMMFEFSLIFSFGLFYWSGISIFTYRLSVEKYIHENFLKSISYMALINVLLIIYTLFTMDPYSGVSITPLYMGLVVGNLLFFSFCLLIGKKLYMI